MTEQMANIFYRFIAVCEGNKVYNGIRHSFETFEKTGAHQYINEIFDGQYIVVDKAHFSEHLMYIPRRFVIAYKDIAGIEFESGINEYHIRMVDGKSYHICMLRITFDELVKRMGCEHLYPSGGNSFKEHMKTAAMIPVAMAIPIIWIAGYPICAAAEWVKKRKNKKRMAEMIGAGDNEEAMKG